MFFKSPKEEKIVKKQTSWIKQIHILYMTMHEMGFLNTVNVRIPDVRFGKPDEKASGYRSSGYRTFGSFQVVRFKFLTSLDRFIYKNNFYDPLYSKTT